MKIARAACQRMGCADAESVRFAENESTLLFTDQSMAALLDRNRSDTNSLTGKPAPESEECVSRLLMHYAIPSEGLPDLAKVGIAYVAMFAWRCGGCNVDFHLDKKPTFCPICGTKFDREERFGRSAA